MKKQLSALAFTSLIQSAVDLQTKRSTVIQEEDGEGGSDDSNDSANNSINVSVEFPLNFFKF